MHRFLHNMLFVKDYTKIDPLEKSYYLAIYELCGTTCYVTLYLFISEVRAIEFALRYEDDPERRQMKVLSNIGIRNKTIVVIGIIGFSLAFFRIVEAITNQGFPVAFWMIR